MSKCISEDCERQATARGMCHKHYMRWRRNQDIHAPTKIGKEWHPLYRTWLEMIRRCHGNGETANRHGKNYRDRGIFVCQEWRDDFWRFVSEVGPKPSKHHSLDRIDNDGPYAPDNVRWATLSQQARNRRSTLITYEQAAEVRAAFAAGISRTEIARKFGYPYEAVRYVINTATEEENQEAVESAYADLARFEHMKKIKHREATVEKKCTLDGCDRPYAGKGYCSFHYYRYVELAQNGIVYQQPKCDECGVDLGEKASRRQRFCSVACRMRWHRREGCYAPGAIPDRPSCSIEGCQRDAHAQGMCRSHYMRYWRWGDPTYQPPTQTGKKVCVVDGCDRLALAKGVCSMHYQRQYILPRRRERKEAST